MSTIIGDNMKIHLDLDCYFVSAERVRDQNLKNRPVVVVKSGDTHIFSLEKKEALLIEDVGAFNNNLQFTTIQRDYLRDFIDENGNIHGIVIAKSYEAKKYGINTGTQLREAICLCPNLVVIKSDHLYYQMMSQRLKEYLQTKIPLLEQYSIDEFFGDLSGWIKDSDVAEFIKELQSDILQKFDLPITIGASSSKWIAKLVTDKNKPYGTMVVPQDRVKEYTKDISIDDFAGIGRNISHKLKSHCIYTIADAIKYPNIFAQWGKTGKDLYKRLKGEDNEDVIPHKDRKGIGISRNFKPIECREEYKRRVAIIARYLSYSILKLKLNPTSYYFKLKYEYGTKNIKTLSMHRLFSEKLLIDTALEVFDTLDNHYGYKIKYIGINASNFVDKKNLKTYSLLEYEKDIKMAKVSKKLMSIRDKFGIDIIRYANECSIA
jgi:DNA polymerase-4